MREQAADDRLTRERVPELVGILVKVEQTVIHRTFKSRANHARSVLATVGSSRQSNCRPSTAAIWIIRRWAGARPASRAATAAANDAGTPGAASSSSTRKARHRLHPPRSGPLREERRGGRQPPSGRSPHPTAGAAEQSLRCAARLGTGRADTRQRRAQAGPWPHTGPARPANCPRGIPPPPGCPDQPTAGPPGQPAARPGRPARAAA